MGKKHKDFAQTSLNKPWKLDYLGGSFSQDKEEKKDNTEGFFLSEVSVPKKVYILDFSGKKDREQLTTLGLTAGTILEVICHQATGSVLGVVEGTYVGIGAKLAQEIRVKEIE